MCGMDPVCPLKSTSTHNSQNSRSYACFSRGSITSWKRSVSDPLFFKATFFQLPHNPKPTITRSILEAVNSKTKYTLTFGLPNRKPEVRGLLNTSEGRPCQAPNSTAHYLHQKNTHDDDDDEDKRRRPLREYVGTHGASCGCAL